MTQSSAPKGALKGIRKGLVVVVCAWACACVRPPEV